jgi:circadian clock protein KaiC
MSTGIPQLDSMLDGGLFTGTTTVALGFSGSGKTTLALHFLDAGCSAGENGLYFGFYEPPAHVLTTAAQMGLGLREHAKTDRFGLLWQPSYEYGIDALLERLLADVRRRNIRRVVIDGFDGVRLAAADPERTIRVVSAVTNELRALDVTTVITDETLSPYGPEIATRVEAVSALFENLVLLEYMTVGAELRRLISILKQRSSGHAMSVREFKLTSRGMELAGDAASAEEILSGFNVFGGKHLRRSRSSIV